MSAEGVVTGVAVGVVVGVASAVVTARLLKEVDEKAMEEALGDRWSDGYNEGHEAALRNPSRVKEAFNRLFPTQEEEKKDPTAGTTTKARRPTPRTP